MHKTHVSNPPAKRDVAVLIADLDPQPELLRSKGSNRIDRQIVNDRSGKLAAAATCCDSELLVGAKVDLIP